MCDRKKLTSDSMASGTLLGDLLDAVKTSSSKVNTEQAPISNN